MKKEFMKLLKGENSTLKLNAFSTLEKYQKDIRGKDVDRLILRVKIPSFSLLQYDINSRDMQGIIEEVKYYQNIVFSELAKNLNKNIENGYLR